MVSYDIWRDLNTKELLYDKKQHRQCIYRISLASGLFHYSEVEVGYDSNNKAMKMITFINLFDNWIFIYCRGSRENLYHSMRYFLNSLLDTFRPMLGFHKSVLLMKGRFMNFFFVNYYQLLVNLHFVKGSYGQLIIMIMVVWRLRPS